MKMKNINQLIRENIRSLKPYTCAREEHAELVGIFLDANENSIGSVNVSALNRYPDPLHRKLKTEIAKIKNVSPDQIFLGNGSDEAIDLLIRVFCEPAKDNIILMPPTYGMYGVCAAVNNVEVKKVALNPDFSINKKVLLSNINKTDKVLFICSPNNPTSNCFDRDTIVTVLRKFPGIVIIDEAYIDFSSQQSWLSKLKEYNNLVVLQTFSKAWGLANIRLGMAFASPEIIALLNKIKYPYNVNGVTQKIALDGLKNIKKRDQMIEQILKQRKFLQEELSKISCVEKVYPSEANFLLVKMKSALSVYQYLLKHQILVRDRSKEIHCEECLRITVGTPQENRKLIQMLKKYE
jgi:histidinol-phosphate aminotransferase